METVIIPPASAAATGFVASDSHGSKHHDYLTTAHFYQSQAETVEAVNGNGAAVALAVEKTGAAGVLATSVASGSLNVAIEKTSAAGQLTTQVSSSQIQNLMINQANLASVQAMTNQAATNLAIEKTAAAGVLLAVQNQAAVLAAIAECCCEQKELIRAQADETRALINANTVQNLRDVLTATQRLIPVTTPVPV